MKKLFLAVLFLFSTSFGPLQAQELPGQRKEIRLSGREQVWKSVAHDTDPTVYDGFERPGYDDGGWASVEIPHNWDKYEGSRQLRHGNRHGTAWYRTEFTVDPADREGKRAFLFFEGVSSYGTVWVNGRRAGYHAGGRTTFTLDITELIRYGEPNTLAVRADHPALIADLPWVCGGCSSEWGFSEGSQPMGIFRPVTLVVTGDVRVEPFGVHVWNDAGVSSEKAPIHFTTELKNYGADERKIEVVTRIADSDGKVVGAVRRQFSLQGGETKEFSQTHTISGARLWSNDDPYLYYLSTEILDAGSGRVIDRELTPFGIRTVSWHLNRNDGTQTFQLNGKPVLLNGIGEYEHNLGQSHAFTDEQILARASQIKQAGFNAFRDAHQPHNLLYGRIWDETGMLWWSQMSAHIWYDAPAFRENFKRLLRDFVKERRNSPSLIMWGLQNESMLPADFARECTEIIRQMDPTTSSQRLVTTCNGGEGTDWNVVQNWSGTYGGNPDNYAEEIKVQILNGEYGAWRSIDWHTEGDFDPKGALSESRMTLLLEMKVRQIESVRDSVAGQFLWIFSSHDNPGRIQNGEGWRSIDQLGPYNYKGLFTPWGEPLDAYYMYRSHYVDKKTAPMVHIVSHTWPDRVLIPGAVKDIRVFSNCDTVMLFNGMTGRTPDGQWFGRELLGVQTRDSLVRGEHFVFRNVRVETCLLTAVALRDGRVAATDYVVLNHLPEPEGMEALTTLHENITQPDRSLNYLYRVNCGGGEFTDQNGSVWMADRRRTGDSTWGSLSWTDDFPGIPPAFGSQRRTWDPVWNAEWPLFRTFRYGADRLRYEFPVPDGEYTVELYFMEPWYGRDASMDCRGWRVFDVAVNDRTVIRDLDLWSFRGANIALKQTVKARVTGGTLTVHFPRVASGQAVISAIAIATEDPSVKPALPSPPLMKHTGNGWKWHAWMDTGVEQFIVGPPITLGHIPQELYGAEWLRTRIVWRDPLTCEFSDSAYLYLITKHDPAAAKHLEGFELQESQVITSGDPKETLLFVPSGLARYSSRDGVFTRLYPSQLCDVYRKKVQRGEKVELNRRATAFVYNVAAIPIPDMGEEPSARPVIKHEAEELTVTGSVERGNFRNGGFVKLNEMGGTIEFKASPGLAGTYLIRFRYMNRSGEAIPMRMELINALNGVEMLSETIWFEPAAEKWRIMSTTTGSQINAGEYILRLTVLDRPGIEFESFEFE